MAEKQESDRTTQTSSSKKKPGIPEKMSKEFIKKLEKARRQVKVVQPKVTFLVDKTKEQPTGMAAQAHRKRRIRFPTQPGTPEKEEAARKIQAAFRRSKSSSRGR